MTTVTEPTWATAFFGPGNVLTRERRARDARLAVFAPFVARAYEAPFRSTLLPRLTPQGDRWLYAVASTAGELARLREDVAAFLGPTYTDLPAYTSLDPGDPIDVALGSYAGLHVGKVRLAVVADAAWPQFDQALRWLLSAWNRPNSELRLEESFQDLYARFRRALAAGDPVSADRLLASIESSGTVGAANMLFLRVERLSGLREDATLLAWERLGDVIRLRRPAAVTAAIAAAVYREIISPSETAEDPEAVIRSARERALPRYGAVLRSLAPTSDPDALTAFAVAALAEGLPTDALRRQVQRLDPNRRALIERLPGFVAVPLTTAEAPTAIQLIERGEYATAFGALLTSTPSRERAALLIQCAHHIGSLEAEAAALMALERLPESDRAKLRTDPFVGPMLTAFTPVGVGGAADVAVRPPGDRPNASELVPDWIAWFERLDAAEPFPRALSVARAGAGEWSIEWISADEQRVATLVARVGATRDLARQRIADRASSILVDALAHDPMAPRSVLEPLYSALFEQFATTTSGHPEDLGVMALLFDWLLTPVGGVDARTRYQAVLQQTAQLIELYGSTSAIVWMLELAEAVADHAVMDEQAVHQFLVTLATKLHGMGARAPAMYWDLLGSVCGRLGADTWFAGVCPQAATTAEQGDPLSALGGKSVAIYTLTESAGGRAQSILERRCPAIRVRLFSSHVADARLEQAARTADIFVLATRSAKHAATNAIKAARTKGQTLLYATGKGAASILSAIESFVNAEA